ncbi:MAG: SEC-C metal-binding domain-containing protein, partial [Candidatus Heritagella sp.]|nr:SEC-C metal-binding domain-containing protein [Candidatus Heritagella sp.]
GERIGAMMDRLNVSDDTPIEAKMLTKTIENAQLKVEDRNFSIRKNVLQYDDVLSRQREVIYTQRNAVLDGADLKEAILRMIDSALQTKVDRYLPKNTEHDNWDLEGLREQYLGWLISDDDLVFTKDELEDLDPEFVTSELQKKAHDLYEVREQEFTPAITRELERVILLKNVDRYWMDHIDAMDELKKGINLRAYAQRDPVVEYRVEGSDMFDATIDQIREDTARMMLTVKLRTKEEPQREQVAKPTGTGGGGDGSDKKRPVRITKKIGRNDPCPCGSGKKYKKCCGRNEE